MNMAQAAPVGDIFVTVTGCEDVITKEHFLNMKDGAICCNAGHFDCEVSVRDLKELATGEKPARNNIQEYTLPNGRKIYIIAEGRLVNLAAGDGHPAEIMDMSFAIQALSAEWMATTRPARVKGAMLHDVPPEIDRRVAQMKLAAWGVTIDTLTPEQHRYIFGF
jgi:adenosylhomocysteinase